MVPGPVLLGFGFWGGRPGLLGLLGLWVLGGFGVFGFGGLWGFGDFGPAVPLLAAPRRPPTAPIAAGPLWALGFGFWALGFGPSRGSPWRAPPCAPPRARNFKIKNKIGLFFVFEKGVLF